MQGMSGIIRMIQWEHLQLYHTHLGVTVTLLMQEAEASDTRPVVHRWCPDRNRVRPVASAPMPHFGPANIPNFHQQSLTPHEACVEDDCDGYAKFIKFI